MRSISHTVKVPNLVDVLGKLSNALARIRISFNGRGFSYLWVNESGISFLHVCISSKRAQILNSYFKVVSPGANHRICRGK